MNPNEKPAHSPQEKPADSEAPGAAQGADMQFLDDLAQDIDIDLLALLGQC